MGLFKKLRGTTEYLFNIGGPFKPQLKTDAVGNGQWIRARNSDDDGYVVVNALDHFTAGTDDTALTPQVDVKSYFPLIYAGFNGASPPSWSDGKFYMCHTSGGSYTAGRVYYKKSAIATPVQINTGWIGHIITNDAITGDISFEADWIYSWDGTAWKKKCDLTAGDSGKQYIAVTIGTSASYSSTASVPSGAVITDVIVDITTAYSATAGISVVCDSNTIVTGTDVWGDYISQYVVEDITAIASASTVTVNISGTPVSGAGKVYVGYVTPKV